LSDQMMSLQIWDMYFVVFNVFGQYFAIQSTVDCNCLQSTDQVPGTIRYLARYGTWHDLADLVPGTI
jgi:hypothetical protein